MQQSPPAPRDPLTHRRITWTDVLAAYAMMAAILLLFWATSEPLAAGVVLAAATVGAVAVRRAHRLARCVRTCRGLAFDLPGTVRVTVAWAPDCNPN